MGLIILILMIGVPIGEIAVFMEAGDRFGFWPTMGAIIATAVIGTACMRIQGLGMLRRVQESMARNEMPLREVFDGLCLLLAGALLLTPGFITDTVGFCLLFPPFRYAVGAVLAARLIQRGQTHSWNTASQRTGGRGPTHQSGGYGGDGPVIDGEYEEVSTESENSEAKETAAITDKPSDPA